MKQYNIIPAPFGMGGKILGAELASKVIIEELVSNHHFDKCIINKEVSYISCAEYDSLLINSKMNHLKDVISFNKMLYDIVLNSLKSNYIPVIIGGDHSISWGSISAVQNFYTEDYAIFYIDAHADINTSETSDTGNIHGMHMAYLAGEGESELSHIIHEDKSVDVSKIHYIGTRSLDPGEKSRIFNSKIPILPANEIVNNESIDQFISFSKSNMSTRNIHISLDVDVLDPSTFKATGVPEKDGISLEKLVYIITRLKSEFNIVSIDFVEYNPKLDDEFESLNICTYLLKELL